MLEENVLNDRQVAYLDWLCTPPAERVPASKAKYAVQFKVAEQTLRRWEKLKVFREEWASRVDAIQGSPDKKFSLLEALYRKAMDGDTRSAELYLKATNQMAPPQLKVEVERSTAQLSDEELDALIASRAVSERALRVV
jgi:hypothetical protein